MSKQAEKALLPTLRFPEFRDAGDWVEKRLGEVLKYEQPTKYLVDTSEYSAKFTTPVLTAGKTLILGYTNETIGIYNNLPVIIFDDFTTVYKFVNFPFKVKSSAMKMLTVVNDADDIRFIHSAMFHVKFQVGVHKRYWIAEYQKEKILSPRPPEQQKIADCLSSLDELITTQAQKLDALKTHKKGLMQQFFPGEGKTLPTLRFPEFRDAGDWETHRFSEVYSFYPTNSFSRDKLNYSAGLVKNIHYGDIHTKFSTLFDIRNETVPFVNLSQSIENIKSDSFCVEGDIILTDASEDLNDVGKSIEIVDLNNENLLSGLHTILARQVKEKLVTGFGGYLFKSMGIRARIQREAQGAKVFGILKERLGNVEIYFPEYKIEQQKIANCLSSLDELISAQAQKIAALKTHKKGLIQQLFPQPTSQ